MPVATDKKAESQFEDSPRGWQARWRMELDASTEWLKPWHREAQNNVRVFLDKRDARHEKDKRLTLFSANVQTQQALLYGKTPHVDVTRRFSDFEDPSARAASEMLGRLLNTDIQRENDAYAAIMEYILGDRLIPGLGCARVRYVADFRQEKLDPLYSDDPETDDAGDPTLADDGSQIQQGDEASEEEDDDQDDTYEVKTFEDVETLYVYWDDLRYSPCRTWHDMRWIAFKVEMTRRDLIERFGEELGKKISIRKIGGSNKKGKDGDTDAMAFDPWARAEVWEIWDKEHRKVWWWTRGHPEILDEKDDPLGLEGFFPCPRFLIANVTTDAFIPRSDYAIAQDLYRQIDEITTRIDLLQKAVKLRGCYDKSKPEIGRMLNEAGGNELIPTDNWAMFAEKGGIKGMVDWLPIDMVVGALDKLRDVRREAVELLYQVTGMSDIMRGEASGPTTATEQSIKAKFASVRMQRFQDEVARFASDLQRLRAEIICKHFDDETIVKRSNVLRTPDAPMVQNEIAARMQAREMGFEEDELPQGGPLSLLRDRFMDYRVEVKPESISLTDYAALKQERIDVISAIASYVQSVAPLAQAMPGSLPFLLEMLQWLVAGIKGSAGIEATIDQAVAAATKQLQQAAAQPQQQKPDPKVQAIQAKGQMDAMHTKLEAAADQQRIRMETMAEMAKNTQQFQQQSALQAQKQHGDSVLAAIDNVVQPQAAQ